MDSRAGQSISSCAAAFRSLCQCAILVVGVAGTMPVHGMGTARFLLRVNDTDVIISIHNCLLCHGETFNLLSVSQLLHSTSNAVVFEEGASRIHLKNGTLDQTINLKEEEGLYQLMLQSLDANDDRYDCLMQYDVTLEHDSKLFDDLRSTEPSVNMMRLKAPSSLGAWTRKVFKKRQLLSVELSEMH